MRRAALPALLLLACACASAPRPGPTLDGIAVTVPSRGKNGARRQAIESLLPLFLTDDARSAKAAAVERAVFGNPKTMKALIGYQRRSRKAGAGSLVEVKIDALSAVLQRAGVVRPPGYRAGPEVLLLALGDRAVGPTPNERFAVDALETALFGRGIQAQDADDEIVKLNHPITAKTEAGTVEQAAENGWTGVVTGGVSNVARHDVQSSSWRGRGRYSLVVYGVGPSTAPARFDADGDALDVSSGAAVTSAIEAAAQVAAVRVEALLAHKRVGRTTLAVLVTGYRDPAFLGKVLADLRATDGIDGAALVIWKGDEPMAVIHAYATTLTAETLAAKLLNSDHELRITAVETEDNRLTIVGPELPESADQGQEE